TEPSSSRKREKEARSTRPHVRFLLHPLPSALRKGEGASPCLWRGRAKIPDLHPPPRSVGRVGEGEGFCRAPRACPRLDRGMTAAEGAAVPHPRKQKGR